MAHGEALASIPLPFEVPFMGDTFDITSTMTTGLAITIVISAVFIIASRKLTTGTPGKLQNVLEWIVGGLRNFYGGIMGEEKATKYLPLLGSLFIFIIVSNYSGLLPGMHIVPGMAAPTGTLSVTVALAVVVFFSTHILGFKANGVHYLGHFVKPVALLLPLMILEEFVRPLSLSLRLYGNIYGEETVVEQVAGMFPLIATVPLQGLSVLFGFIQALVFTMLTAIYIDGATGSGH